MFANSPVFVSEIAIAPSSRSLLGRRTLRLSWFSWLTRIANDSRKISVKYRQAELVIQSMTAPLCAPIHCTIGGHWSVAADHYLPGQSRQHPTRPRRGSACARVRLIRRVSFSCLDCERTFRLQLLLWPRACLDQARFFADPQFADCAFSA